MSDQRKPKPVKRSRVPKHPKSGTCHFCKAKLDSGCWCFGCEHFICPDHARNMSIMGLHHPELHLVEESE